MLTVRPATEDDVVPLNDMYNRYIADSAATFDIEPITIEDRRERFRHYALTGRYRVFVAWEGDLFLGYASSSPYRPKQAYETSVETSIYLEMEHCGRGVGTALYSALFDALSEEDIHRALAGITMPNPASVALHEKFGFRQVAYFTEQGRKFGKYWDVAWFEKEM